MIIPLTIVFHSTVKQKFPSTPLSTTTTFLNSSFLLSKYAFNKPIKTRGSRCIKVQCIIDDMVVFREFGEGFVKEVVELKNGLLRFTPTVFHPHKGFIGLSCLGICGFIVGIERVILGR
jgi:hypothetical protein